MGGMCLVVWVISFSLQSYFRGYLMKFNKIALSVSLVLLFQVSYANTTGEALNTMENTIAPSLEFTKRGIDITKFIIESPEKLNLSESLLNHAHQLEKAAMQAESIGWTNFTQAADKLNTKSIKFADKMSEVENQIENASKLYKNSDTVLNVAVKLDGLNKITKYLDVAGKSVDFLNNGNNLIIDLNKASSYEDAHDKLLSTIGSVGLYGFDTLNIFANDKNPMQLAQVVTWAWGSSDNCTKSHVCSVFKGLGDPIGTGTDITRKIRDGFDGLSEDLKQQNESDELYYQTINNFLDKGIWASKYHTQKIYSSESFDDLLHNANDALDANLKSLDNFIKNSEAILVSIDNQIKNEESKPLFMDWGSKKVNIDTHNMRKETISTFIEKLKKRKKEITQSRNKYLEEYGLGWLQAQAIKQDINNANLVTSIRDNINQVRQSIENINQKPINNSNNILTNLGRQTQNQTSHFGTPNMATKPVYNNGRTRQTIQENPYLARGSVTLEAPADIVLRWGNHPADLDSHLTGPVRANSSERFHIHFENKGSLTGNPNAMLYRDDTSHGAGSTNRPEQTRINVTQPGVYNFYVHDFSNKGSQNSKALSQSGATVTLYSAGNRNLPEGNNLGKQVGQPIPVPKDKVGTVWHSFELDTRRNTLTPKDTMSNDKNIIK